MAMNGFCSLMMSSIPALAWNAVSMSSKITIDPSAPLLVVSRFSRNLVGTSDEMSIPSVGIEVRPANGVVERETQRFVSVFAALAAIEQVLLQILQDREENTTSRVASDVTVGAGNTTCHGR